MNIEKIINHWIEISNDDFKTMNTLFKSKSYNWALFVGHISVEKLLKAAYPYYAWYHQGIHKRNERGIDFIGNRIGDAVDEPKSIGVQVKFHAAKSAPTQLEWLKFLSGCFARRLESAIFITSGKLTSEQRREAQEARITIIEGREEISRLAKLHSIGNFELFE